MEVEVPEGSCCSGIDRSRKTGSGSIFGLPLGSFADFVIASNRVASMKIRHSGMPDEAVWKAFFQADEIISSMGLDRKIRDAADFGCGYGTFTIPAAKAIAGIIYAIDIDPNVIDKLRQRAHDEGVDNVVTIVRNILEQGSGLEGNSTDYVMLFNVLHAENPHVLLDEAYRVLRPAGIIGIINWILDPSTPRGPPLGIRPTIEQCAAWCNQAGFRTDTEIILDLKPYHYGMVMRK